VLERRWRVGNVRREPGACVELGLSVAAWNDDDGGELDVRERIAPTEQAREQFCRERRGPAPAASGIPDRSASPCQRPEQEEGNAVAIAPFAATCPRHPPQAPAGEAGQGGAEAPGDPRRHGEQAENTDCAREGTGRGDWDGDVRRHVVWCTSRLRRDARTRPTQIHAAATSSLVAKIPREAWQTWYAQWTIQCLSSTGSAEMIRSTKTHERIWAVRLWCCAPAA
jgi:hypothetical protein